MKEILNDYIPLMESFLKGNLSPEDFQKEFLERFSNEERSFSGELWPIMEELWGDVEFFCGDKTLYKGLEEERPGFYLDEEKLREKLRIWEVKRKQ